MGMRIGLIIAGIACLLFAGGKDVEETALSLQEIDVAWMMWCKGVVVGTVDGNVVALHPHTGDELWTFESGGPLVHSEHHEPSRLLQRHEDVGEDRNVQFHTALGDGNGAVLVPGVDGTIFAWQIQSGEVERLSVNVREMVDAAPFRVRRGPIYTGKKETRVFAVNPTTGHVYRTFTSSVDEGDEADTTTMRELPGETLFLGRSDYSVSAIHPKDMRPMHTFSVGEFVSFSNGIFPSTTPKTVVTAQGRFGLVDRTGSPLWEHQFASTVISAFALTEGNVLTPLEVVVEKETAAGVDPHRVIYGREIGGQFFPAFVGMGAPSLEPISTKHEIRRLPLREDVVSPPLVIESVPEGRRGLLDMLHRGGYFGLLPLTLVQSIASLATALSILVASYFIARSIVKRRRQSLSEERSSRRSTTSDSELYIQRRIHRTVPPEGTHELNHLYATPIMDHNSSPPPEPISSITRHGLRVGRLTVHPLVLGYGSHGTIVYEGELDDARKVAVKRMLGDFYRTAEKEIELMIHSDAHNNVVRYFAKEEDGEFVYLALERCTKTLSDLVEDQSIALLNGDGHPRPEVVQMLKGIVSGVAHLHALNVVHRDLKPQNVLLTEQGVAKISDMGLSKKLDKEQSSFDTHSPGSFGWQAPEVITQGRQKKTVDIFSTGCLLYYVLDRGRHPFGDRFEREMNIIKGSHNLNGITFLPEAYDLIQSMLDIDADRRPSATESLRHPFFWTDVMRLAFLQDLSDRIEKESPQSDVVRALEAQASRVVGVGWHLVLDRDLLNDLGRYRKYNFSSLRDLLRVLRNKKHHFREASADVQKLLGSVPDGLARYFFLRFPTLVITCYSVVRLFCKDESCFRPYFT